MALKLYGTSIALPAPFVAGSCDPVDARLVVETFADLTTNAADTFGTISGTYCKVYEGMQVYVTGEKTTYMFVGESDDSGVLLTSVQKAESWRKLSDANTSSDKLEEAIAEAEQNAKDYADSKVNALDYTDTAVAKKFVTEVSETDGVIAVKRGSITSTGNTITITDTTDGGVNLDVVSSALTQYIGQDAINVSAESGGNKTISLKIKSDDKVLTQSADGLLANIDLTWSTSDGLKLIGKEGTAIATIPATDFVKDGMLQNVELKTATDGEPIEGQTTGTFLVFTFNTDGGSKVINVNVTSLIDVYTGTNGINVSGKSITAVKDPSSESFLQIGATGIAVKGVQDAINVEKTRAQAEETRITDTVIGEDQLTDGKSVMDVILENEETTQHAIEQLATAAGVLSGEEIKYTAPAVSGEFNTTTSMMDMLNKIDEKWNVIDCGTY